MNRPGGDATDHDLAAYYRRRAASYERVYDKPERQADLRAMQGWIEQVFTGRRVLELACGTGWWTRPGARGAASWLATDLNDETLAIARAKPMPACVSFAVADAWQPQALPQRGFDAALAAFWWSHLPRRRLAQWVDGLHAVLEPGARVVVIDNRFVQGSSTPVARRDDDGDTWQRRRLDDGSEHEVLKNFPDADEVRAAVGGRGTAWSWTEWPHYWAASWSVA